MNIRKISSIVLLFAALVVSCSKEEPAGPVWPSHGDGNGDDTQLTKPEACPTIVVAHRGGSTEAGTTANPDNSRASLRYAKALKCYASECDIYWTKDDKVVVAHADATCCINGLHPWEATLDELRKAGKLSNGEDLPSLEDFLDIVMEKGSCTKLWLDIKNITSPSTLTQYPINATRRACEIIKEKKASNFVEFICTGNATVMASANNFAITAGCPIGWMANKAASEYKGLSYSWANLSTEYMTQGGGARTFEEFTKLGIDISVFNADTDEQMAYYIANADKMKAICTNYPRKLIEKLAN